MGRCFIGYPRSVVSKGNHRTAVGASYHKFCGVYSVLSPMCLSSIILSPLNGYVKMSPYETGDICIEPERIATRGGDFILLEGEPGVCQSRLPAQPNASTCQTTQIPVTARR